MRSCFYSWDNFYAIFEELNQEVGRLIPLILTIGNHDVGYDALAEVTLDKNNDKIPYFFLFNPQHTVSNNKSPSNIPQSTQVPEPSERLSYHSHIIGPTLHLHLDSGYVTSFEDQNSFIDLMSSTHPSLYKFANYHNPIYPSCTDSTDGSVIIF